MSDACQIPEYRNSYCTPSFHQESGKLADSGNATKTNWKPTWRSVGWTSNGKPQQMTELTGDVHRVWELQTLSGDGSSRRQRRESGERTENMTTTLQTVQYACAMCVVEYVDQQTASTATYALIEHKSFHPHYHHHFGWLRSSYSFARDCKRERERERERESQYIPRWL